MRLVIQRVTEARVRVDGKVTGEIGPGLLVLVGIGRGDDATDVDYAARRVLELRLFADGSGRHFEQSLVDTGGQVLVVSQFTLYGDVRRGRRPSFDAAAPPEQARGLYEDLVRELRARGAEVATGVFQAAMQVELVNDGPVTVLVDSKRTL